MGRTKPANPDRKLRPCMKCRKPFESEHIGNRICPTCKDNVEFSGVRNSSYWLNETGVRK